MRRRFKRPRCACETRYVVNFADDRGEQRTDSLTAAMASGLGFMVRLMSVSRTPMRPITPALRIKYGGSDRVVNEVCQVCGWPTKVEILLKG